MKIQVLGPGCANCKKLYERTQKALTEAGVKADIEKVESFEEILKLGVPMTPALVIDGEVKSSGKLPEPQQIVTWLSGAAAKGHSN